MTDVKFRGKQGTNNLGTVYLSLSDSESDNQLESGDIVVWDEPNSNNTFVGRVKRIIDPYKRDGVTITTTLPITHLYLSQVIWKKSEIEENDYVKLMESQYEKYAIFSGIKVIEGE